MASHPLLTLSLARTHQLFRLCAVFCALVGGSMVATGQRLHNEAVPLGIFSLELNFGELPRMLASYEPKTLALLGFQLGVDFLFLGLYSTGLALGLARSWHRQANRDYPWLAPTLWGLWLAGALDAAENIALYRAMFAPSAALGWWATGFAAAKFALLLLAAGVWLHLVWSRPTPPKHARK